MPDVGSGRTRDRSLVEPGPLEDRHRGQQAPIAPAPEADAAGIDVRQRLQILHAALEIVDRDAREISDRPVTELAAVADAAADINLKPDVLTFDGEVLLQRGVRASPLVPHRVGIDRTDDDGIPAGSIEMRRLHEAAVQRNAVHSALERHIARLDPRVLAELLGRRVRDLPFRPAVAVHHVQLGGRDIVRAQQRDMPAVRRHERLMRARQRRDLRHRPAPLVHPVDLPLVRVLLRRDEHDLAGARRHRELIPVKRRRDHAPVAERERLIRPVGEGQFTQPVPAVDVRHVDDAPTVGLPLGGPQRRRRRRRAGNRPLLVQDFFGGGSTGHGEDVDPAVPRVLGVLVDEQARAVR